jgi:hypothetical protein
MGVDQDPDGNRSFALKRLPGKPSRHALEGYNERKFETVQLNAKIPKN